jgi:glycine/D-amino acid oxidase-like deaminating enzyme
VTLFEAALIGGDTTAHNHGRLHLGTAGWYDEMDRDALVARRLAGSKLSRELVDLSEAPELACYWFSGASWSDFEDFLERHKIPARKVSITHAAADWIGLPVECAYELDEYGFDPARTAGRLVAAVSDKATIRTGTAVDRISIPEDSGVGVFVGEDRFEFDLVINTAGRHGATIPVDDRDPVLALDAKTWRVLCARLKPGNTLRQVLVMADSGKGSPSLVGHGDIVTFDHKDQPMSPPSEQADGLLDLDSDPAGAEILERVSPCYDLSGLEESSIRVFTGTQGRVANAPPGSIGRIHSYPGESSYHVASGGQASTAVLDALDIVRELDGVSHFSGPLELENLVSKLANRMGERLHVETAEMVWRALGREA